MSVLYAVDFDTENPWLCLEYENGCAFLSSGKWLFFKGGGIPKPRLFIAPREFTQC